MQTCSTGVAQGKQRTGEEDTVTLSHCHTHLGGRHCTGGLWKGLQLCALLSDSKLLLPGEPCQGDLPSTEPQQLPLPSRAVVQGLAALPTLQAAGEGVTVSPWGTAEQSRELHAPDGGTHTDASL